MSHIVHKISSALGDIYKIIQIDKLDRESLFILSTPSSCFLF